MLGVMDSIGDFWCAFLFMYCQQKIIRQLRIDLLKGECAAAFLCLSLRFYSADCLFSLPSVR